MYYGQKQSLLFKSGSNKAQTYINCSLRYSCNDWKFVLKENKQDFYSQMWIFVFPPTVGSEQKDW